MEDRKTRLDYYIVPRKSMDRTGDFHFPFACGTPITTGEKIANAIRETTAKKRLIKVTWREGGRTVSFEDIRDAAMFLDMKPQTLKCYLTNGAGVFQRRILNRDIDAPGVADIYYEVRRNDGEK